MDTKKIDTKVSKPGYTARITRSQYSIAIRFERLAGQFSLQAERLLNAKIYEVAAGIELVAAEQGKRWPVSARVFDQLIALEIDEHEFDETIELAAAVLKAHDVVVR